MKRKNWTTRTEDPPHIDPSFRRGLRRDLCSKTRLNDGASRETLGIRCNETVRVRDLGSCKLQGSASVPVERNQSPSSDDPKTSEYAFFKKLKEDTSHIFHSHQLNQDKTQSINFKRSDCSRERSNIIENSHKNVNTSLPENVKLDMFPYISPPDNRSKKSDMKRASTTLTDIHNKQDNVEGYGFPCKNAGIFSKKRHKLRQLVAKTSFPEVDELLTKGLFPEDSDDKVFFFDLLSDQTPSMLIMENFLSQSFGVLKTETLDVDTKPRSLTSKEFDIHFKKSHWTSAGNFMERDSATSLDVGSSSCWSGLLRERELPNPKFPNCNSCGTYLDNSIMELDYESSKTATSILCTQGDSAFDFDVRKCRCHTSRQLKELDEFHYPIEPLHGQEPRTLLLGWDVDNTVDRSHLCAASQNTELSMHPIVSSLHNDRQQNLDHRFTANRLFTESLVSYNPPNLLPLQFSSAGNKSHHFAECVLEVNDDIAADADNFLLSSPDMTNRLYTSEYSHYRTGCKSSSIFLSPLNQLGFMRKILNENHHCPGKEALYHAGLDFDIEPKCKPVSGSSSDHYSYPSALEFPLSKQMSLDIIGDENKMLWFDPKRDNHLCDDMIDSHDWSSSYIQMPLDKEVFPLLCDKSHWDESDGKIYYDEDKVKF